MSRLRATGKGFRRVKDAAEFGQVAVLMGGSSAEREISLLTGKAVLDALVARGVQATAFDPKERALFTSIKDAVTARGDIEATTDSMSDGQALAAAGDLVELLATICLTLAVEREPPAQTE